jgi:hypothetical protein
MTMICCALSDVVCMCRTGSLQDGLEACVVCMVGMHGSEMHGSPYFRFCALATATPLPLRRSCTSSVFQRHAAC